MTSALVYRDVKVAAFHEMDNPDFPLYFNVSQFSKKHFDWLGISFKKMASAIPIDGEQPSPSAAIIPSDPSGSISQAPKVTHVPKPRKKVTAKAQQLKTGEPSRSEPPVLTPVHSDNEDARGSKRAPESPTTPRKGQGKKKQKASSPPVEVRRGKRDRTAPKRFDENGDIPLAPAGGKGRGRGGAHAQRGRNGPKKAGKR